MKMIASSEAEARFSKILQAVAEGEIFIITRNGRSMAELRPCPPTTTPTRLRGAMRGKFGPISTNFQEIPADFADYQ